MWCRLFLHHLFALSTVGPHRPGLSVLPQPGPPLKAPALLCRPSHPLQAPSEVHPPCFCQQSGAHWLQGCIEEHSHDAWELCLLTNIGLALAGTSAGAGPSMEAQNVPGSSPGSMDSSGMLSNGSTALLRAPGVFPSIVPTCMQSLAGRPSPAKCSCCIPCCYLCSTRWSA